MQQRGFEVELVLALTNLLKGQLLDSGDYQVINCASLDEKFEAFDKVISRLLYKNDEKAIQNVRHFKLNLELIRTVKKGQKVIINSETDPKIFSLISKSEFVKHYPADYGMVLENALKKLICGDILTNRDVLAICVAGDIDLIDAFGYALKNILSSKDRELGEITDLNMYIFKSLKLTSQVWLDGANICPVTREDYEISMTKTKDQSKKIV